MISALTLFLTVVLYRIIAAYGGVEHAWLLNFSPLVSMALCGPAIFPKRAAWILPLATLLASDVILNARFGVALVTWEMLTRYVVLALIAWIGLRLRESPKAGSYLTACLAGSTGFFLITNTVSWLTDPGYAKTLIGWWQALTVGLPGYPPTLLFFRNSLVSDVGFTLLFLACHAMAKQTNVLRNPH